MKAFLFHIILILLTVLPSAAPAAGDRSTEGSPAAVLHGKTYSFDTVLEGEKVTHDFIIQNNGSAVLMISAVKTSCGCTAASYSKEVLPGESGKITLILKTGGYGGKTVNKTARVETNDPDNRTITLSLTGRISAFAEIDPKTVVLNGKAGDDIRTEIRITPNSRSPFSITGVKAARGENISLDLKEIREKDGVRYLLTVINLQKTRGEYKDTIYLTTDSDIKPRITIKVSGEVL